MDVFTRAIRGWHLSCHLTEGLTKTALQRALSTHIALRFITRIRGCSMHRPAMSASWSRPRFASVWQQRERPTESAYVERPIRTLKEEEVCLQEYEDFADAYNRIGRFLDEVYMYKRIHSSLGYLTPAEFEAEYYHHLTKFG